MYVTTQLLSEYVHGQLAFINHSDGTVFCGEIKSVVIEDKTLKVQFKWLAKENKAIDLPQWIKVETFEYSARLELFECSRPGNNRIALDTATMPGETAVFYPPGGIKLRTSEVEGLELLQC